jgi:hypothetical protein
MTIFSALRACFSLRRLSSACYVLYFQAWKIVNLENNFRESLGRGPLFFVLSNSGLRLSDAQARTFNHVFL